MQFQSIRVLLAFALQNDLLLHQMDVGKAFLNGTPATRQLPSARKGTLCFQLAEEVLVLLETINTLLEESTQGVLDICWFVQSSADPCIYVQADNCPIAVTAYVDDLMIAANTKEETQQVNELLQSCFK